MQKDHFFQLLRNPGLLDQDSLPYLQQLTRDFPFFQAAWMLYLKNLLAVGHPGFEQTLKKAAVFIPDRKQLHRFLYADTGLRSSEYYFEQNVWNFYTTREDAGNESEKEGSLIDRFLSRDPAPMKMENPSTVDDGEDSSEEPGNDILSISDAESEDLVTETLAMIYFEQKKYDKALDAFKKLSLKYPEKSVYFATRIEEIEKLKNI